MNSIPKGYVEVRKGVYERITTIQQKFMRKKTGSKTGGRTQTAKPKPPLWDEPLSKASGEKIHTGRLLVSIESVRKKLLDTDNLYGGAKFFVDFLRYCGAIEEDTEAKIDLRVTQRTTLKNEKEKTIIEVWKRER
jgi:hypothetical protein